MGLINRLLTPKDVKDAAHQMLNALTHAAPGHRRALELPVQTDSPDDDLQLALVAAYMMREFSDRVVINRTTGSLIIQLREAWIQNSPEGRDLLKTSGREVQTGDAKEILATGPTKKS